MERLASTNPMAAPAFARLRPVVDFRDFFNAKVIYQQFADLRLTNPAGRGRVPPASVRPGTHLWVYKR